MAAVAVEAAVDSGHPVLKCVWHRHQYIREQLLLCIIIIASSSSLSSSQCSSSLAADAPILIGLLLYAA